MLSDERTRDTPPTPVHHDYFHILMHEEHVFAL